MAQTKPKAAQFYGVSGDGTAGQVLISDGNGGMSWGANTELFTISWNTPTGQGLTYTQPSPQSSEGTAGSAFPTTTFIVTKSDTILSGTATIAGLPTGITATQVITGGSVGNTLTVTLSGIFPGANSLNTNLIISGLTLSKIVSWATPTGQSLTYTQPSPQSSTGIPGTTFTSTTFTVTKSGEEISGTATIAGLPTGITATQSLSGTGADNVLTVTLTGIFPGADSLNTALTLSGLTVAPPLIVDYLVVAGGGGGGGTTVFSGGAGAGGLRTSYGSTSGGGSSAETSISLLTGTNYLVTVGSGGVGGDNVSDATNGTNSVFHNITSNGGGGGGGSTQSAGGNGGSGGGSLGTDGGATPGAGTTGQGFSGGRGDGTSGLNDNRGGGGGGAAAAGAGGKNITGNGGAGLEVNIIGGTGNYYAGGGGGGKHPSAGSYGAGGVGGGGAAGVPGTSGTANTGGGGGMSSGSTGATGGSGIVILRYPNSYTISGLSGSTTTVGSERVTTFISGTGNIQFN